MNEIRSALIAKERGVSAETAEWEAIKCLQRILGLAAALEKADKTNTEAWYAYRDAIRNDPISKPLVRSGWVEPYTAVRSRGVLYRAEPVEYCITLRVAPTILVIGALDASVCPSTATLRYYDNKSGGTLEMYDNERADLLVYAREHFRL